MGRTSHTFIGRPIRVDCVTEINDKGVTRPIVKDEAVGNDKTKKRKRKKVGSL